MEQNGADMMGIITLPAGQHYVPAACCPCFVDAYMVGHPSTWSIAALWAVLHLLLCK